MLHDFVLLCSAWRCRGYRVVLCIGVFCFGLLSVALHCVIVVFWFCLAGVLGASSLCTGCVLVVSWLCLGCLLVVCVASLSGLGCASVVFWLHVGCGLVVS